MRVALKITGLKPTQIRNKRVVTIVETTVSYFNCDAYMNPITPVYNNADFHVGTGPAKHKKTMTAR